MNFNGKEIVDAIVTRIKEENRIPNADNVVKKLQSLDKYKIRQLIDLGDIEGWIRDRNAIE